MSDVVIPNTFVAGTVADATAVNQNFQTLVDAINAGGTALPATILNAANYGYLPASTGAENVVAMQALVDAAIASNGAQILIPTGIYQHNGTVNIVGNTAPGNNFGGIVFQGASAGVEIVQNGSVDTFDVSSAPQGTNNGGIRFRDLQITYISSVTGGTAINANNGGSLTTAEFCYFQNCPTAFSTGVDGKALFCGLLCCEIVQTQQNNSTQVIFSASQSFLIRCVIRQTPIASGGPTGCTGVEVYSVEGVVIADSHISDFTTGISVMHGCNNIFIRGNELQSWKNSIVVQTQSNTGTIYGVWITDCYCALSNNSTATGSTGIIVDGLNGAAVSNVQGIFINNTMCVGFANAGLQIGVASNVNVNGGMYASNGQNPTATALGAGIVVSDAADSIRVANADLIGVYYFLDPEGNTPQPYAAALSGGCTNVGFFNCNMLYNNFAPALLPVYTSGTITHWTVSQCRGYNTINFSISSTSPGSNIQFDGTGHGTPITQWTTPYLGSILVAWVGATVTSLKTSHDRSALSALDCGAIESGTISLYPPQSMSLTYTGSFTGFQILGQ